MAKRALAAVIAVLLALPPLAMGPASGDPRASTAAPLRVRTEWDSPDFNGSVSVLVNDTDQDGRSELIVWGELTDYANFTSTSIIRVFRPPSKEPLWTADLPDGYIDDIRPIDIHGDGTVELLLERSGRSMVNITVLSGKDFSVLWQGPDLEGELRYDELADIDADGEKEFVLVNETTVYDSDNGTYSDEAYIHIFGALSHQKEWTSPAFKHSLEGFSMVQLDPDPALELGLQGRDSDANLTMTHWTLAAYDGASHSLAWSMVPEGNLTAFSVLFAGDADNDTQGEVVVQSDTAQSSELGIYSGLNGSLLWNRTMGNTTNKAGVMDVDGDGAMELLATGSVRVDDTSNDLTHYLFDIKSQALEWSAGPFRSDEYNSSSVSPLMLVEGNYAALEPGYLPYLVMANSTMSALFAFTVTYDILDGRTFALKWRSPVFSAFAIGQLGLIATQSDSDPARELVASELWVDPSLHMTGQVHLYSEGAYTEEWSGEVLPGIVQAVGADVVGDARPELFMMNDDFDFTTFTGTTWLRLYDGDSHDLLWTSPQSASPEINSSDLYGSARREIVFAAVNNSLDGGDISQLYVYNDTTYEEAWTSGRLDGTASVLFMGDLDGDGLGELVTTLTWQDPNFDLYSNITVREFDERAPLLPDLFIDGAELALSNSTPVSGMPLELTAKVRNLGNANATGCCVTLLVDGGAASELVADVLAGNLTEVVFCWTAAAGEHTLTVSVDRQGLMEESDEGNNNASLELTVGPRPPPTPVITSPREGEVISFGANITFNGTGTVFSPGGQRWFYWTSHRIGYLGNTSLFSAVLPTGQHRITLFADDGFANASASVNLTVKQDGHPPDTTWAVISSPLPDAAYTAGDPILFDANGSVAAQAGWTLAYYWRSNRTGPLGDTASFTRTLPAGYHNITLTIDDGHGGLASAWVHIRVNASSGVVALISSPREGQRFNSTEEVFFDGTNSSAPAGTAPTFVWSSSLMGTFGSEKSFTRRLVPGDHAVTLRVSDGAGRSASATVNITVVNTEIAPSVSLASPLEGATLRGLVLVTGTAHDDIEVRLVQIRIDDGAWEPANGTASWSFEWNTSMYANGPHRISVRASDGNLSSPEASVNVSVANPLQRRPPVPEAFPTALSMAIGVLLVVCSVVMVLTIYMLRRRRAPPQQLEDQRSEQAPPGS